MHILKSRPWNLPESQVTPESLVFGRRKALALGAGMLGAGPAMAQQSGLPPAMRNTRYPPGRTITPEHDVTTYNNFYEFGSHKTISAA
ncbi:MAG: protein-methionine-sulfoxide reductase catalytic subunit MsrP, partial [Roseomonas sp.]|nr:protein-methionine-sulfoxide reductase catalytic subunit MsrP [Roseomonas sp.]